MTQSKTSNLNTIFLGILSIGTLVVIALLVFAYFTLTNATKQKTDLTETVQENQIEIMSPNGKSTIQPSGKSQAIAPPPASNSASTTISASASIPATHSIPKAVGAQKKTINAEYERHNTDIKNPSTDTRTSNPSATENITTRKNAEPTYKSTKRTETTSSKSEPPVKIPAPTKKDSQSQSAIDELF